ncbi:MAG: hypothetical protein KAR64_08190 [Thermoplasmatales archaeon]|nr:hypothetical protein [Thermoplasmatales archaeon]
MISEFKQLEKLFHEIDKQLKTDVNIYVIGGVVLLYHGLKPATKDIDVLFKNQYGCADFFNAITELGYETSIYH